MLASYFQKDKREAGCDEVGRGCLAGSVVAASIILPKDYHHPILNDSKQLTKAQRTYLKEEIITKAIAWSIGEVFPQEIDKINILNASFLAMHRAIEKLKIIPELLLIDGNRFNAHPTIPHQCIIRGDSKFFSIAAASVIAKTYRDEQMKQLSKKYPEYGWDTNVGYPTQQHREAIKKHGITPYHRKSFRLSY